MDCGSGTQHPSLGSTSDRSSWGRVSDRNSWGHDSAVGCDHGNGSLSSLGPLYEDSVDGEEDFERSSMGSRQSVYVSMMPTHRVSVYSLQSAFNYLDQQGEVGSGVGSSSTSSGTSCDLLALFGSACLVWR